MSTNPGGQPKVGAPTRDGSPAGELEIISSEVPPASHVNDSLVIGLSIVAAVCGLVFGVTITLGGPLPLYGGALAIGLLALAYAVRRFFTDRYPEIEAIEPRLQFTDMGMTDEESGDLAEIHPVGRRSLVRRMLIAAAAVFGAGLLAPVSTLGPRVGNRLRQTAWAQGKRLVTTEGNPLRPDDLPPGGVSTVWPEGAIANEFASTLLLRLATEPEPPTNLDWVVDGSVLAYSKVCTHAGCPVALFRERDGALFCPCHQSTFDVVRGAQPTFGPAARALPQLPLGLDDEGYLVALGDYTDQIGPAYG
ncbi:MAG: Rieske 2Fe-2S domain-containing protein [Nitriliruptorales bacterium]|nr:Rieske 2Fe-2S domain-containing protein [Nitriliruptorales bacterium]